ncbi:monovalent cation/H+ antiporter subunit D [Pseudoalteromonas fenneropenaei]|uniref:Monovalent cation/H+ antiporter subunit D n=1 Tax=Pseudoalteromonas fenneropenaei TaxID=1737459 RepID=A0ABV7CMT2_9GAMM
MLMHLIALPILLPMLAGVILLMPPCGKNVRIRRIASVILAVLTTLVTVSLLLQVLSQGPQIYALGNWQAPFGIVLVADPLAVIMTILTSLLALVCAVYSTAGDDERGGFFHPLLHFLLLGVNGAFLTGDAFNLFVFFEVLLIASYSLLMHAADKHTTRAALQYVIMNLVGSAVFLIALGTLYGVLGTLNMADMAQKVGQLSGDDVYLAKIGGLLLLVVFALKAALLPLHLWLPSTYASATPVVGAIFAIMTKVGVYSMLRVYTLIFGEHAGELNHMAQDWLWGLALATIVVGAVGVLASQDLRKVAANLVIVSVGTLVALVAVQTQAATAAAIYYMVHSTLVSAALFLLADLIARQRGKVMDRITAGRAVNQPLLLALGFGMAALTVIGMPPLSGFIGKIWLLNATLEAGHSQTFWPLYLFVSFALLVALARAGATVFWQRPQKDIHATATENAHPAQLVAVFMLLLCSPLLAIFAGPMTELSNHAAVWVHDYAGMLRLVLGGQG